MIDSLASATARFIAEISPLTDTQMSAPSRLPGWSRGHVATHIARNADGMVNLCAWARTGIETPMYPTQEIRNREVEYGATRPAAEIVADVINSAERLVSAFATLDATALKVPIRRGANAVGPQYPASAIPWMRLREVEIHLVDLDLAATFARAPVKFLTDLLTEETPNFDSRMPGLTLITHEGPRFQVGDGAQAITGSIGDVTAWLLGRANPDELSRLSSDSPIPAPPKWL